MERKNVLSNLAIKQEPNTSNATSKKVLLSSSSFSPLSSKSVSNARLPSFKPPRDLFLTGSMAGNSNSTFSINSNHKSTRKTFMPNINVTRKKGSSEAVLNDSTSDLNQKNKERDKIKKSPFNKKRNANVVQTKGVFSEGLAPGKVKAFGSSSTERSYNESQVLEKPKLNLNKKIVKTEEDLKLKSILKDDFLDDPSQVPDISFVPNCLPVIYNVKKPDASGDLEKTFDTLQVKSEKMLGLSSGEMKNEKPFIGPEFENNQGPKMFLFEFPSLIKEKDEDRSKKKKNSKGLSSETDAESEKSESLSSLGEGFFGCLRIHENGRAFLVIGKTTIPLCLTRHGTRQEIMSAGIDGETSKGELISLGTIDSSFTCEANIFEGVS